VPNRTATLTQVPRDASKSRAVDLAEFRSVELKAEFVAGAQRRAEFLDAAIRSQTAIVKAMIAEREHILEKWIPELQRLEVERVRLQEDRVKEPRRRERLGAVS
jgi:hypothetical protein